MNDFKTIKKIFNLAYYDFTHNLSDWFSITGLYAVASILVFSGLSYIAGDIQMTYWAFIPNLCCDWIDLFFTFYYGYDLYWISLFFTAFLALFYILFPVLIIQNCLDLAFDSSMRGISFSGPILLYSIVIACCHGIICVCYTLLSSMGILGLFYLLQSNIIVPIFLIKTFIFLAGFILLYSIQAMYILGMHILEYKKGIYISVQEFLEMMQGKMLFVAKILLLQILIVAAVGFVCYVCFGFFIMALLPWILVFFDILSLSVLSQFVCIMYNFFYAWIYLLCYVWICLVAAHIYRQLICPPVENVTCLSCSSCEK